jgi:isopenicillin N synthase-like dioxygenase
MTMTAASTAVAATVDATSAEDDVNVDDLPASAIPVIDMTLDEASVAASILDAFSKIGFATLTKHDISPQLIRDAFVASKAFFARPLDEKMARRLDDHKANRGYIPVGAEAFTDTSNSPDKKETFDIGNEDELEYTNKWPTDADGVVFQTTMIEYFQAFDALHLRIMRLLAVALHMPDEAFFVDRCNERHENLRLLHYPSVTKLSNTTDSNLITTTSSSSSELIQRGAIHTDYGTITLLCQDGVGGLRAQTVHGTWVNVPPVPDSIVVNVGDMLQRWSNDLLRATPHQVVELPSHGTIIPERFSIAFFCNANKSVMLECLKECMAEQEEARYEPVNAHEYLTMRLSQTISAGAPSN